MFPPIPYLEWVEGRPEAATYDLGSSDLRQDEPADDVVPPSLVGVAPPEGDATLRTQLAACYDVDESNVLVTAGATHANFLAAAAAIELVGGADLDATAGPQILVEKPGYQPLVATPEALGARVDRFFRPVEDGYPLIPERVANAADDVALVSVTNRHNPSGRLSSRETLAELARVVADDGGYLLVDEVYAPYVETVADGPFGGVTGAGLPNTVVTNSLTKFHGLGGLRVGWLVGPERFVEQARKVIRHVPAVAEPSVALARRALHHEEQLTMDARALLRTNHGQLASFVEDRSDLAGPLFDGSTFGCFTHETADGDAVATAAWDRGVLVVPGRFFGHPEAFRLSLGRSPDEVEAGLSVLGDVLDSL
jgi:aspartate/methionine/tyrosine aminotransferase